MIAHPSVGFFRVRGAQRLNDALVLLQGGLHAPRESSGCETKNSDVIVQGGNQTDETTGLREHHNGLVKS